MGHEIHYKMERINPKEVDAQAVADMKEYLGDERFGILVGLSAIAKTFYFSTVMMNSLLFWSMI